jgi:dipeptide/tripeptide permease
MRNAIGLAFTGLSFLVLLMANATVTEGHLAPPEGGKIDLAIAQQKYGMLFDHMLWLGLGSAVVALLLSPLIKRWMHDVK